MPKSVQIDRHVSESPEVIANRLREKTRWSLYPAQGSFIRFGNKPLKGTVKNTGFSVGSNHRDWFTLLQPVARCSLTQTDQGTKIYGTVGLPRIIVWVMRLSVMIMIPMIVVAVAGVAMSSGGTVGGLSAVAFAVFAMLCCVVGVGINMNNSNGMVDEMNHQMNQLLEGFSPQTTEPGLSEEETVRPPMGQSVRE